MPRFKRTKQISGYQLAKLDRQAELLQSEMREALVSIQPFSPHYDAIMELADAMKRARNLLNDRPIDYEKPHQSSMPGRES